MKEYTKRFLGCDLNPVAADQAKFHLVPIPYEATTSYGQGTAFGPDAILKASDQLEVFDGHSNPGLAGIFTQEPIIVADPVDNMLDKIAERVFFADDSGAIPVCLGGEHTVSYGPLKALQKRHGRFGLVQIDAHADLREEYRGSHWSHACIMRRIVENLDLPLVQLGNRAFSEEEYSARQKFNITAWDAPFLARHGIPQQLLPKNFPKKIYITFDLDGLDPSIIPDTGTPVPGGLGWYQCLELLEKSIFNRQVIGFDIVELAPKPGFDVSPFTAACLVYVIMGMCLKN